MVCQWTLRLSFRAQSRNLHLAGMVMLKRMGQIPV